LDFLAFDGDGTEPARITDQISPADLAEIDQQRAQAAEKMNRVLLHTITHIALRSVCPDDRISLIGNAEHLANEFLKLDRRDAIGIINLAMERLAQQSIEDMGGTQNAYEHLDLDGLRKIFHGARDAVEESDE